MSGLDVRVKDDAQLAGLVAAALNQMFARLQPKAKAGGDEWSESDPLVAFWFNLQRKIGPPVKLRIVADGKIEEVELLPGSSGEILISGASFGARSSSDLVGALKALPAGLISNVVNVPETPANVTLVDEQVPSEVTFQRTPTGA